MILNYQRWLQLNEQAESKEISYFTIEYSKLSNFPSNHQQIEEAMLAVFKELESDVKITNVEGFLSRTISFNIRLNLEKEEDPFGLPFEELGISMEKKCVLDLYEFREIKDYELAASSKFKTVVLKKGNYVYLLTDDLDDSAIIDEIVESEIYSKKIENGFFGNEVLTYSNLKDNLTLRLVKDYLTDKNIETTKKFMKMVKSLFRYELAKIRLQSITPFKREKVNLLTFEKEIQNKFLELQAQVENLMPRDRQEVIDSLFDFQAYLISKVSENVSAIERKVATVYSLKVYDLITELDPSDLESTNYLNK
jgi:hypothetical protein